jgi:peroxiredoxin
MIAFQSAAGKTSLMALTLVAVVAGAGAAESPGDRGERAERRAPAFRARLLDGGELDLAALRGRKVVVLDFWASWCGPCVDSLPVVRDVVRDFDDVALYAVNQQESEATIRRFLARHRLELAVALDPDSTIGDRYGVDGIPHLVVIDRDGVIRGVHEGFSSDLRRRLRAELAELARRRSASTATAAAPAAELRKAWNVDGRWTAVAADPRASVVYAIATDGSVGRFGAAGERQATFQASGTVIRTAHLTGGAAAELLVFTPWGDKVQALDAAGRKLWTYEGGSGVDDVWAADLDGDGRDEVLVGTSGGPGLHVLDSRGRRLWVEAGLGHAWTVCAADLDGDRRPEVLAASQRGEVWVFGSDGMRRRDLSTGVFATLVRPARTAAGDACVVVGGSNGDGAAVVGLGPGGRRRFTTVVGDDQAHLEAAAAAPGRPWLATSLRGGRIKVVDVSSGALIAEAQVEGRRPDLAWLASGDEPPLLLVATGRAVAAYRVATRTAP